MTETITWTWKCMVADCGAHGTGADYDTVVNGAAAHNQQAEHFQPAISYGNDAPEPEPGPVAPNVYDLFNDAANAVQAATDLNGIKAAFATLQENIAPFVTPTEGA